MKRALAWRKNNYYDRHEYRRVVHYFETEVYHIEGELAGQAVVLEKWQKRMLRRIFAWKRKIDHTRKHRKALVFVPRGQGKTIIVAGCGNYLFSADKEQGAQVIAAAAETDQAEILFKYAKGSVVRSVKLSKLVGKPFKRSMAIRSTGSNFKVISSTADTKHGMNLHGVLIDELHNQPNRELVDVLMTSTRTRTQPLILFATTAGFKKDTICGEMYNYGTKVRDGIIEDEEFLPVIYESDPLDDWKSPETWKKANPNFGISVKESYLQAQCKMAQEMPSYENTFRRLHLNQWTEQETRWMPMDKWSLCGKEFEYKPLHSKEDKLIKFDESQLLGMPCIGGLDLSDRLDITALVLLFQISEHLYYPLMRFWVPNETALERQRKGQAPYHNWIKEKKLLSTPGNDIDYNFIESEIKTLSKIYKIREIGFDPWNANQLTHNLNDTAGIKMVPFRQGYGSMSSPSKEFEAWVVSQKFRHGNNPVLNWMASNICISTDPAGNIKPVKGSDRNQKIDGIIALIMAIGRTVVSQENSSVYETRGALVL